MIVYESVRTGTLYPREFAENWGRHKESDGYGPQPVCTDLVPAPYAKKTRSGEVPLQVCRGALVARDVPEAEVAQKGLRVITEITPRRGRRR